MSICPLCQRTVPATAQFCPVCGARLDPPEAVAAPLVLQQRYVLREKLGQGGMGTVYRASDLRLSTVTWAIKCLSTEALSGQLDRQRAREAFRQEAEMLAGLAHANLPRVTDHFEQDGLAYLVMEFVPGETLQRLVQREGLPQALPRVLDWARQLADVLNYLHSRHPPIVFRDLKPSNVMLTPDGTIKLIDFGIARLFKPGQSRDTQAFGTMGYSAPEQYGRGQTDARSDVYALGVMLHHFVTGYDPSATPFRVPPAHQLNPQVPMLVSQALSTAMDHDPERRFATVPAFLNALFASSTGNVVRQQAAVQEAARAAPVSSAGQQTIVVGDAQPPVAATRRPTTALANLSRWLGIISLFLALLAGLLVGIDLLGGVDPSNNLQTVGFVVGILPALAGPTGLILGFIALVQDRTALTRFGKRHALIGMATGLLTPLFCCAAAALAGSVT